MEAYNEGQRAYWAGVSVFENPYYIFDPLSANSWFSGWVFAQWVGRQGGTSEE